MWSDYLKSASQGDLADKWKQLEEGKTSDSPIILEPSAYKYDGPIYNDILKPQCEEFFKRLVKPTACWCSGIRYTTMIRRRDARF